MLTESGISVKIIDKDEKVCQHLGDLLPKAVIIHGDGANQELLMSEGLSRTDAFVSLTGADETNILISMFAMTNNVPKIITKINRDELIPLAEKLGLESIISPKKIVSDLVQSYARALENSLGSNVETLYSLSKGKVEAAEFYIRERSAITDTPLQELRFKENVLVAGIVREGRMIIPRGQDSIQIGDSVIIVSRHLGMHDICDILE